MATVPETQAFIDELNTPTVNTKAQVRVAMKPFQVEVNDMCQQLARTRRLLGESEMEEPSDAIRSKFEGFDDSLRTGERLLTEIHKVIRETERHFRAMVVAENEIKDLAEAEGYTV